MNKINCLLTIGVFLLILSVIFPGCKKKKYPAPEFTLTYQSVVLQTGNAGVNFYAACTTTDVAMTRVEIIDPNQSGTITYNLNGVQHVANETFPLQDVGISYQKVGGVYQFTFIGNRVADNEGFTAVTRLNVAK